MNAIRLYFRLVRVSLRTQMAYRASFSVQMLANIATTLADFFAVFAFFQRFGALGHWSFAQVAVFYGMANASLALSELWLRGFDIFERHVQSGDFDRYLIRPRSSFLQVLGADFQLLRLGRTGVGLVTSFWGLSQLAPGWQASEWALFFLAILGGNFFYGGVVLVRAMVSVWTVQSLELFNMITYGGVETAQYPLDIYTGFLRRFFFGIVPLAATNYWPLSYLFHRPEASAPLAWLSPLICLGVFLLGWVAWHIGVKHYRSTGS